MRVVLASSGGTGHFNPLRPVADTLVRRGDEVLVVVPPDLTETVEATGLPHRIGAAPPDAELAQVMRSLATMPPAEAGRAFRREVFGRLCTAAMLPTLDEVCEQWRPDLVLREPAEFASAIAARRHGVPQARIAISLATASTRATTAAMPSLLPYGDQLADELHASPYLTRLPAALDPSPFPVTHRFREPAEPPGGPLPDWWNGQDTPLVYVTFGSVTGGFDD
ncbi:MAG: hypothetical protein JO285_05195, partial [Kutzneria sp.]|nr:hypothetical protein [Kutzneria sp.]